ncbi:MAG: OB-fold putative lipoprotein [Muribaculaceae bacterium]|nr:OB-fold putative lipoprotein [Muribaculaceae bacterium]
MTSFAQTSAPATLKNNDNKTVVEVYNIMKGQGRGSTGKGKSEKGKSNNAAPIVNISGYAVKVGPDVYGLPSVELSETKGGKARILCVLPFTDYLKLRHVSKGDKVIMKGEVRGYIDKYDIVLVKESKIVTVNGKKP